MAARQREQPGADAALGQLCEAYWYPLYLFVRRNGHAHEEALDLTQGYFLRLMEREYLDDVKPQAGKFRSFLLASLKHYLLNARRDATRIKRGGGRTPLSLDATDAEGRYLIDPSHEDTPERAFERVWAHTLVERAKAALHNEMEHDGKARLYQMLRGHLSGDGAQQPYREIADVLGRTEAAVKMSLSRLRRRFANLLREEIARTVDDPEDVDAEIRHLLTILR